MGYVEQSRSLGRAVLRRGVYPALTTAWGMGFALAGRLHTEAQAVQCWDNPGGQRVGIVAPHPDDETVGCGGAACLHRDRGDHVAALIVTDGGASRAGGLDRPAQARRRAAEAAEAAAVLGL